MNDLNVCLTGLPRAGTTLMCQLLNKLPDTLALHEPMKSSAFSKAKKAGAVCEAVEAFFRETRASVAGTNTFVAKKNGGQRREKVLRRQLHNPFTLCLKHPAAFTALLPELAPRFRCYAIIRNPLSVLGSWNHVAMSVNQGHSPVAEVLSPELSQRLVRVPDKTERQFVLLSWYFEQYALFLSGEQLVRYEDLIASGGKILRGVSASAEKLAEPLKNRNRKKRYGGELMQELGEKLLRSEGVYWQFYSKESVEAVLQQPIVSK